MALIDEHFITMLRVIINDLDTSDYTYTDSRLEQIIATSAFFVNEAMDLNYIVDPNGPDITPNPFDVATPLSRKFINLVVLKSACTVDFGTFRQKAMVAGLTAKMGPATMQTLGHLDGFKQLIEQGPCAAYEKALVDYKLGSGLLCEVILSPFTNDNFDPSEIQYNSELERFTGY